MFLVIETNSICFATEVDEAFCMKFRVIDYDVPYVDLVAKLDDTKTYSDTMLYSEAIEIFSQTTENESFITEECGEVLYDLIKLGKVIDAIEKPHVPELALPKPQVGELQSRFTEADFESD